MTQFFKTLVKLAKKREKQNKLDEAKEKAEEKESEEEEEEQDEAEEVRWSIDWNFVCLFVTKSLWNCHFYACLKDAGDEEEEEYEEEEEIDMELRPLRRIKQLFPKLTKAKIDAGVFIGPDVLKILKDEPFHDTLTDQQRDALDALKAIVENFLGNYRAPNYVDLVNDFLTKFEKIEANMSLKMHFLKNHLNEFVNNLGVYSDQHGERFHQDIKVMEKRYKGKNYVHMLGDHCWRLIREAPDT